MNQTSQQEDDNITLPDNSHFISSQIQSLKEKYYFHEILSDEQSESCFLVEDLDPQFPTDKMEDTIVFMKQLRFADKQSFQENLSYYQRLFNYCQFAHVKKEVVQMRSLFFKEIANESHFEIVFTQEYGEKDRVDLESINQAQIIEYLRSISQVLSDLKKYENIYHGGLSLKSILLVDSELKLGCFWPVANEGWKAQFSLDFSPFKLDILMLGFMWLQFLGFDIDFLSKESSLE